MMLFLKTFEHEELRFFLESIEHEIICEVLVEVFIVVCLFRVLLKLASPAAKSVVDASSEPKTKHDFSFNRVSTVLASKTNPERSNHGTFGTDMSTQMCGSRTLGRVKSYSATHGYGFLACRHVEEDIFFAQDNVNSDDLHKLRIGSGVTFTLSHCPQKGRFRANSLNLTFNGVVRWRHHADMYAFITCVDSCVEGDIWFSPGDLVNKTDAIVPGSAARFLLYWNFSHGCFRARKVELSAFPSDKPTFEDHVSDSAVQDCHIDQALTNADGACKKLDERTFLSPSSPERGEPSASNDPTSSASARPAEMTRQGIVKSFNAARGYGFVHVSGMSQDVWFAGACVDGEPVAAGMHVQTEVFMVEAGKYRATWVRSCGMCFEG